MKVRQPGARLALQARQQVSAPVGITGARFGRKARRTDAGQPAQCSHLQARIVRQGQHLRGACKGQRFEGGILCIGCASLFNFQPQAKHGRGEQGDGWLVQQRLDLDQFARIARCDQDFHLFGSFLPIRIVPNPHIWEVYRKLPSPVTTKYVIIPATEHKLLCEKWLSTSD